ncbi:MAG: hypothetical protein HeimAB125_20500 [Candidatus Heimdallarchaeota archaeon AB_125]|nr:MAG: hypothetical protein HeimAB125_20500 [Candidatus Heimdallarchaeota archaeon AB_125]
MVCCSTTLYSTVEVYYLSIKGRRKIDYECNLCKKTRILYVLPSLHHSVDEKGYVEYVDIHPCEDDRLNANILYVDKSMTVRSQVPVRVGDNMTAQEISTLQIPVPKKVDFKTAIIEPDKDFKYKNLKFLKITDRLRQTIFQLKEKSSGKTLKVTSELEFIDIEIKLAKSIDSDIAEDWLKQLASILEAIVLLDEEMLSFMALYLDPKISKPPSGESIIELDMILHAKSSFPIASLKSYATFRRQWPRIKNERKGTDFESYEKLLTYCIGNQYKTLLDIYFKAESAMSFLTYIDRIEDMSMLGLINIRKTEFFTVDE